MRDSTVKWLSALHSFVYRRSRGHLGSRLVNNDMLLLTTTGRITRTKHTVPLLYLADGEALIVIASYGGRESDPHWYLNLAETPRVTAQIRNTTIALDAATLGAGERHEWWARIVAAYADYAVYQSRTTREIPIVRLTPI